MKDIFRRSLESLTIWMYSSDDMTMHHEIVDESKTLYTALEKFCKSKWSIMSVTSYTGKMSAWIPPQLGSLMALRSFDTGTKHLTVELGKETAQKILNDNLSMWSPAIQTKIKSVEHLGEELRRSLEALNAPFTGARGEVLADFHNELETQYDRWGSKDRELSEWITIVAEELGETAHEVLDDNWEAAYKETIQIAVAAFAMAEQIKRIIR